MEQSIQEAVVVFLYLYFVYLFIKEASATFIYLFLIFVVLRTELKTLQI